MNDLTNAELMNGGSQPPLGSYGPTSLILCFYIMSMILDNTVHCPLVGSSLLVYHLVPSVDTKSFYTLLKINEQRRRPSYVRWWVTNRVWASSLDALPPALE
jgi:hypothetical protein